jgi:hypothetical protein
LQGGRPADQRRLVGQRGRRPGHAGHRHERHEAQRIGPQRAAARQRQRGRRPAHDEHLPGDDHVAADRRHVEGQREPAARRAVESGVPGRDLPGDERVRRAAGADVAGVAAAPDEGLLAKRHEVHQTARRRRPERWSGATRNCSPVETAVLEPERRTRDLARAR